MAHTVIPSAETFAARRRLHEQVEAGTLGPREMYEQALALDPNDFLALTMLGSEALTDGRVAEARRLAERAIWANPGFALAYMIFTSAVSELGETELLRSMIPLALRRGLQEKSEGVERNSRKLLSVMSEDARNLWESEPKKFVDQLIFATDGPRPGEPDEVLLYLHPLRMALRILDPTFGLEKDAVDDILEERERCAPLLIGLLRGYAQKGLHTDRPFTADAALALLGAMQLASTFDAVREFTTHSDEDIREIAIWAARRIALKHPQLKKKVKSLPRAEDFDVYEICGSDPNWEEEPDEEDEEKVERPKLGRNDPCWCGSGKKYKKCHMDSDAFEKLTEEAAASISLVMKLMSFGADVAGPKELGNAEQLYFEGSMEDAPEEETQGFITWLVSDYRPKALRGNSIVIEYATRYAPILSDEEKHELQMLIGARVSMYEVLHVEGSATDVHDVFLGDKLHIEDEEASAELTVGDVVLGRLLQEEHHYAFAHPGDILPGPLAPALKEWIREEKKKSSDDWHEFLRANSHRIRLQLLRLLEDYRRSS